MNGLHLFELFTKKILQTPQILQTISNATYDPPQFDSNTQLLKHMHVYH